MKKFSKPVVRKHKNGNVRIVRDSYSNATTNWYDIAKEVKKRDGYKCVSCKKPEDPKSSVYHDVHHIRSLSKGGTTTKANLITLCKVCHGKRHKHL